MRSQTDKKVPAQKSLVAELILEPSFSGTWTSAPLTLQNTMLGALNLYDKSRLYAVSYIGQN